MDSGTWYDDSLAYHREQDDEANAISAPPASERVRWAAFWLVDFITPEVLPTTIARLKSSPLNSGDRFAHRGESADWLAEARTAPLVGGYTNLPICARPHAGWSPSASCEDLPEEFEMAQLTLFALTPGLQAVYACFYLAASAQTILHDALARPRQTEAVPLSDKSVTFRVPSQQKSNELELTKKAVHSSASAWLGRNIPGVFSANDQTWAQTPVCDYILTRNRVPYTARPPKPKGRAFHDDYMHVAGLHGGTWDTWQSDGLAGFRLALPSSLRDGTAGLTLAARERDIAGFAEAMYGGPLAHRTTHKLHHVLDDLLITWGLHELADHHHADLSEQRDSWSSEDTTVRQATQRARNAALTMGKVADSRAIARDLLAVTEPTHFLQRSPLTLHAVSPVMRKYRDELHEGLVATLKRKATALDTIASDLEAMTVASSNIDAAVANLSLQQQLTALTKWLVAFTVVLVALTLILIYQAYVTAP